MQTVSQLKKALRHPNIGVFATVCVPASAAQQTTDAPIVVPVTKSALRGAIKHLPDKTVLPFVFTSDKVIVGAVG